MTCPSCGSDVPPWAAQCPQCGADLSQGRRAAQETSPEPPPAWASAPPWPDPQATGQPPWGTASGPAGAGAAASGPAGALRTGGLAGWWYRVGATVVDSIIVGIVQALLLRGAGSSGAILALLAGFAYQGWFLSTRGQTPGMMAVGTRLVDAQTGANVSFWRGVGRAAVEQALFVLFVLPGLVDILWPLRDPQRRTLHDKAVGTLVVHAR